MGSLSSRLRRELRIRFPRFAGYRGINGQLSFTGSQERAASIAEFFCGQGATLQTKGRGFRPQILPRAIAQAADGGVAIFCPQGDDPGLSDPSHRAVEAPLRVVLARSLPDTVDALRAGITNSSVKEDLRRIRKTGFTCRVTKDPDAIRTFYTRYYTPLVRQRFPDDGRIMPLDEMLASRHGELLCADLDGSWVAGIFNTVRDTGYAMGALGIRDADETIRQKRVVSALLFQSLQRAIELGQPVATLGWSLPFLGKGPIWFKAKWGAVLETRDGNRMQIFMDLRHDMARAVLARNPLVVFDGEDLAVAAWLAPGEAAMAEILRESTRYPGISRWYALAEAGTLQAAAEAFGQTDAVVPVPVDIHAPDPVWLGQVLRRT